MGLSRNGGPKSLTLLERRLDGELPLPRSEMCSQSYPNPDLSAPRWHLEKKVLEQLMARLYGSSMTEMTRLPKPVASNWEWQYEGACRSLPTEMFFHPDGERGPRRRAREIAAKAVCASCPVIAQCRAHALAAQEPYGIWGGLTEDERLEIISKATRQPHSFSA